MVLFNFSCFRVLLFVIQNAAVGDKVAATRAINAMSRLSHGLESDDEAGESCLRIGTIGEVTIVHSGRKYIVRKNHRNHMMEIGR